MLHLRETSDIHVKMNEVFSPAGLASKVLYCDEMR